MFSSVVEKDSRSEAGSEASWPWTSLRNAAKLNLRVTGVGIKSLIFAHLLSPSRSVLYTSGYVSPSHFPPPVLSLIAIDLALPLLS